MVYSVAGHELDGIFTRVCARASYFYLFFVTMCVLVCEVRLLDSAIQDAASRHALTHPVRNPWRCINKQGFRAGICLYMKHTTCLLHTDFNRPAVHTWDDEISSPWIGSFVFLGPDTRVVTATLYSGGV